jgi:hypothetical protein
VGGYVIMTSDELRIKLAALGVSADAYCIGSARDESYCLVRQHSSWSVFYGERGGRTSEVRHDDEAEACQDLLDRLMGDSVIRRQISE